MPPFVRRPPRVPDRTPPHIIREISRPHPLHMSTLDSDLPGPEWVRLRPESIVGPEIRGVVARLGDTSPTVLAGGGFEDRPRPLRRGIPFWGGYPTPTLPLSLIIGASAPGPSVERECLALTHLAGGMLADDPDPPELIVRGKMIPPEAKGAHRWVIADLPAWDTSPDGVLRDPVWGYRVRQAVDIVLMLVSADDHLTRVAPARAKPRYRHVKAKDGDTFEKIAKRELGSAKFAHKLAALNGRGGGSVSLALRTGLSVKVPTGALLAEWRRDLAKKKG